MTCCGMGVAQISMQMGLVQLAAIYARSHRLQACNRWHLHRRCWTLLLPSQGLANVEMSLQVVLDTLEYGSAIKKTPVVVGNCTGFAVNRVFFPYTQAACLLVDLGLDPYKIDKAILGGFGMPMGPFRSAHGWSPRCQLDQFHISQLHCRAVRPCMLSVGCAAWLPKPSILCID